MDAFKAGLPTDIPVLRDAIAEIEHGIQHLERSNREIEEFNTEGHDPELAAAIEENVHALATKRLRVAVIKERIQELGGSVDCTHVSTRAAPPPLATPAT